MSEISGELYTIKLMEEIRRLQQRREVRNKKVNVTTGGIKYRHGLGFVPGKVLPMAQSDIRVWEWQRRDATHVYLMSSANGDVILTIGE